MDTPLDTPPEGSSIVTDTLNGRERLKVPHDDDAMRYLIGAFMVFWLVMWGVGVSDVGGQVLAGEAGLFHYVWLAVWLVAGGVVCCVIYSAFRPQSPEQLVLEPSSLWYDTGRPVLTRRWFRYKSDFWRVVFWRRRRREFDSSDLGSLSLRESIDGNRLTIDHGADRLELAAGATDVERDWIYRQLANAYDLRSGDREAG
jgi:cbb3-type cytochrome oxidase subunit 3